MSANNIIRTITSVYKGTIMNIILSIIVIFFSWFGVINAAAVGDVSRISASSAELPIYCVVEIDGTLTEGAGGGIRLDRLYLRKDEPQSLKDILLMRLSVKDFIQKVGGIDIKNIALFGCIYNNEHEHTILYERVVEGTSTYKAFFTKLNPVASDSLMNMSVHSLLSLGEFVCPYILKVICTKSETTVGEHISLF